MLHVRPLIQLTSPSITEAIDLYSYSAVHPHEFSCFVWHGCSLTRLGHRCSESSCLTRCVGCGNLCQHENEYRERHRGGNQSLGRRTGRQLGSIPFENRRP